MESPKPHFTLSLNTELIIEGGKDLPIANVAAILKRDMEKTLEAPSAGQSRIRAAPPDPSLPAESWIIEVGPEEIVIRHSDSLGCVYALLFISEHWLGVTPFWFWNDQCFAKQPCVTIAAGLWHSPHYAVRFRGWFVNDEVLIDNWRSEPENAVHWALVFETLLRCGCNMTIPGTDANSRKNRSLAAGMGLRICHHHSEPLGAEMFLRIYPDKIPSYSLYPELFEKIWEESVIAQKEYTVFWGLGFRGQGDRPFWNDDASCQSERERGELISGVISRQYEIVKRHVENPVCCINLYGEITDLYRNGNLKLPDGVIKIWADNGFGRMVSRRQWNSNPRVYSLPAEDDRGPHGIYYHCSFHDLQASNHLTMSPNPADFLAAELGKALRAGAGEYWIINCGSIKGHVHTLDLVSAVWRDGALDVNAWRERYVKTYYGEKCAGAIASLFGEYAACTAQYGPNEDDRAGEQLWHHPVRELLCAWMRGETEKGVQTLVWLAADAPFGEQAAVLEKICRGAVPRWKAFCEKCAELRPVLDEKARRLFDDSLYLSAMLHLHGALGALDFCESFSAYRSGDTMRSFLLAYESFTEYRNSLAALAGAEHGEWTGYYSGDCLTDVRLTAFCLDALVSYLRVLGDGADFHEWERAYLTQAAERNIMHLSSKQRAMTNEELAARLKAIETRSRG